MIFPRSLETVGTTAVNCRNIIQSFLLLVAIFFLGGRGGALATLLPRFSEGASPAPLQPHHALGIVRPQLRTPVATRSCSTHLIQLEPRLVPSFLSWWTSSAPEFTEASLAGEWDIHGKLQDSTDERGDSCVSAADAAVEALSRAVGPKEAATLSRVLEALQSGKPLSLSLAANRVATLSTPYKFSLGNSFSVAGIWQLRRRPFLPTVLEVELAFPEDAPEVILILQAPVKSGTWLKQVPQLGRGEASLSFSPFFPWKSHRLRAVEIKPHGKNPSVDTLLQ
ncbi:hypothetical protein, conserved [Eimeria brunetti]|uniref:Transmembrane protein n=1 Tax=Eimeria brunetti TaxID=51314 RepID=U6LVM0_9EIME|nr:hypothetical protein, conserved [Eimeria brunetti]